MTQETFYTDEELVAFLDGETEFAPVDDIAAALKADPVLARRVEALRMDTGVVKQSFASLSVPDRSMSKLNAALSAPVAANSNAPTDRPAQSWGSIAAAAVLALAVGFGAGRFFPEQSIPANTQVAKAPGWKAYVASYQSLYASETLASVDLTENEKAAELTRVAAAIGKSLSTDDLTTVDGVDYKRAQILNFKGKPLIQLAFLSRDGAPLALCIVKTDKGDTPTATAATLEGMSAASWSRGGYDYLLIGGNDQSLISDMAAQYIDAI